MGLAGASSGPAAVPYLGQLGKWLVHFRRQRHMSVRQLAEKASVSRTTISRIENGGPADPSMSTVLRLQQALEVPSIEMLLGGPESLPSTRVQAPP